MKIKETKLDQAICMRESYHKLERLSLIKEKGDLHGYESSKRANLRDMNRVRNNNWNQIKR